MKLDRARAHVKTLKEQIATFNRENRGKIRVRFEPDPQPTYYLGYPTTAPALPDSMRVTVGDAIHNYRSVFDNLMWAMARRNNKGRLPYKYTAFPMAVTEKEWKDRKRSWEQLPSEALAWVQYMQPYPRRYAKSRPLARLNRLDNDDKHRAVHDVRLFVTDVVLAAPSGLAAVENHELFLGGPLRLNRKIVRVRILGPPNQKVEMNSTVVCDVGIASKRLISHTSVRACV